MSRTAALTTVVAMVLGTRAASADDRILDDTAYTVPPGKIRAGLWKLQYGVANLPGLEVGTYLLPYATWAFGVRSANVQARYQLIRSERWAITAGAGLTYADLTGLDVDAKVWIVPTQLLAAVRVTSRLSLGAGVMYTRMTGEASYNEDEAGEFRGAVAVDNAQAWLSLMFKLSTGWSLYLESRGIAATEAAAQGDARVIVDDRTTVDVVVTGKASIDELKGASSLAVLQWSGQRFRLRVGVGYGNFNLPIVNFILPEPTLYPELDLFWVF